jgi:hypothetical protein
MWWRKGCIGVGKEIEDISVVTVVAAKRLINFFPHLIVLFPSTFPHLIDYSSLDQLSSLDRPFFLTWSTFFPHLIDYSSLDRLFLTWLTIPNLIDYSFLDSDQLFLTCDTLTRSALQIAKDSVFDSSKAPTWTWNFKLNGPVAASGAGLICGSSLFIYILLLILVSLSTSYLLYFKFTARTIHIMWWPPQAESRNRTSPAWSNELDFVATEARTHRGCLRLTTASNIDLAVWEFTHWQAGIKFPVQ